MAIHWQIPFKSLRSGTDYTVNIYDSTYSGSPIILKGGAQPFTTQESDDDDEFIPIRTHTGYLRIVDDGKAVKNNQEIAWSWKELLPATDTDRPVTLTAGGTVVWQGFMQSQNFGGVLYGNPQEREFPIQCPLAVLEGTDINYQHTEIENFAYLLQRIVNAIDVVSGGTENSSGVITTNGTIHINNIYVQGNTDAQSWLLKRIDWQNFADEDSDGNLIARFNLYQCLEDLCRFWGWTARTYRNNLYLTCADDSSEQSWLTLTRANLDTMAGGSSAGTTGGAFSTLNYDALTDIFASVEQNDYRQRGANRSTVKADTNRGDDAVLNIFNDKTIKAMKDLGNQSGMVHYVLFTNDLLSVNQPYLKVSCREGYASLNVGYFGYAHDAPYENVVRIKKTGANNATPFVTIETPYEHNFSDGFLRMYGQTYRFADEYLDPYDEYYISRSHMYARIAIGKSKSNAMWWNGQTWQSSPTFCRITIGNKPNNIDGNKNEFAFLYLQASQGSSDDWGCNILPVSGLQGKLFIDLLGTDDTRVEEIDGERSFELRDLKIEFTRNPGVVKYVSASDTVHVEDIDRPTYFEYKSSNQNNVRMDWNADCIYATENKCKFCYGELINPDGTFCETVGYGNTSARPEQHLANRVTNYWAAAKRKLTTELRADKITEPSPMNKVTLDSTTGHPIAISHDWRDDIIYLTTLEL